MHTDIHTDTRESVEPNLPSLEIREAGGISYADQELRPLSLPSQTRGQGLKESKCSATHTKLFHPDQGRGLLAFARVT